MIVCLCHGLNDRQVQQAIDEGATSAGQVYQSFGVKPRCGKCVSYVRDMVRACVAVSPANEDIEFEVAASAGCCGGNCGCMNDREAAE